MLMAKSMALEFLTGVMDLPMRVIFRKIIFMGKVHIHGKMQDNILEIGKITKCMEAERLLGLMVENM